MARYRWNSATEWLIASREKMLADAMSDGTHTSIQEAATNLLEDLRLVVIDCADNDGLQDIYQSEMDADGFFRDLSLISELKREACVRLLEDQSIECRDDETVEELRQAVESNVEDGTIAWGDVEEAHNQQ